MSAPGAGARVGLAVLAALALSSSACGRSGCPRLEGRWRGVRAEGSGSDAPGAAHLFAQKTEFEVSGDTMTMTTPSETQSGRYRVVYENDTSVTITTDRDGADWPQTFAFEGPKGLRWLAAQGESIVFAKQQ